MSLKIHVLAVLLGSFICVRDVAGILSSSPPTIGDSLSACPGDNISVTCIHEDDSFTTRWVISSGDPSVDCVGAITHADTNENFVCGPFALTMFSDASPFNSTIQARATAALNGAIVQCFSSGNPNSQIGNVTINVLDIPTPTIESVEQVSQSLVRVNLTVDDTQCVANYRVDATPEGTALPPAVTMSTSSLVDAAGLNVCQYNYSLAGSTVTAGGVQGSLSEPVSFSADLSVLNGITVTVNQMDPLIQWEQMANPDYPTCISGYVVTDQSNNALSATVGSTVRSLTAEQLNATGFPYCISIHPVVTPETPMGLLMPAMDINNTYTNLIDPDFPIPILNYSFGLRLANETLNETEDTTTLRITIQDVSDTLVPTRNYQYTFNGTTSNVTSFTGSYFEIELLGADGGDQVGVTVMFENGQCDGMAADNYTVPMREITNVVEGDPTEDAINISMTLPLTPQEPGDLQIISSTEPAANGPVIMDYPGHGSRYTVMFMGLTPDTEYMYTIRIVLRSDNIVDVVNPVTGTFMTLMMQTTTPPPTTPTTPMTTDPQTQPSGAPTTGGCEGACIGGIIAAVIVVFVIILAFIVVFVIIRKKKRSGSMKVTSHEMEQHKLTATNNEEPGSPVKDEPATSDTFKTDGTSPGDQADSGNGATGGEGSDPAALIYADLDLAKKSKPKDPDTPTGAAATGGEESVHYATIDHLKKKDEGAEAEGTS